MASISCKLQGGWWMVGAQCLVVKVHYGDPGVIDIGTNVCSDSRDWWRRV